MTRAEHANLFTTAALRHCWYGAHHSEDLGIRHTDYHVHPLVQHFTFQHNQPGHHFTVCSRLECSSEAGRTSLHSVDEHTTDVQALLTRDWPSWQPAYYIQRTNLDEVALTHNGRCAAAIYTLPASRTITAYSEITQIQLRKHHQPGIERSRQPLLGFL